jgi:WD40 repeat protein
MYRTIYRILIVLCLSLLFQVFQDEKGGISFAAEPPKDPILRIETGMHTAWIGRIGLDAENRYLITGSHDKTVRVWELATGRLIRIIRPPIGEGNEGKIFAIAISPDGKTIACGGSIGWDWERTASIYLFDRESGRLTKRISGLSTPIHHLTYSKDGRFLGVTLLRNKGIRVYETSDYTCMLKDEDYGDDSHGADFNRNGGFVTASYDGFIRLYDQEFRLISKNKAPAGNRPYSVSFSPDGSEIAVGFWDSPKVDILSGKDLSYLFSPETSGVNNRNLRSVAWSLDGEFLYAAGDFWKDALDKRIIRKWSRGGKGLHVDLPGTDMGIRQILPLKDGGIAFCSLDPAFGVFDRRDKRIVYKTPATPDFRDNQEGFLISYSGTTIQFGYEQWGKSPARFSIPNRLLEVIKFIDFLKSKSETLNPPLTKAEGLNITNWKYKPSPKLNGKSLKLGHHESSTSLAISPDGKFFLLGAEFSLNLFWRDGKKVWRIPAPGTVRAVNISGNGKVSAAALADGTIRWYRLEDGKELLALFPHNDRKRWVLWSPSGYYDASPGAEELIGWHVNNGQDQAADFFPASKFRSTYYRPDVIAKVLETLDEKEGIRLANAESGRRQEASVHQMLPPIINILSPHDGAEVSTSEIKVSFSIRNPSSEPITGIKALVDGRPVSTQRAVQIVPKDGEIREMKVTIPERESQISIIAENKFSASEPATVRLKWRGKVQKEEFVIKPKLYVLAVGISRYEDKNLTLDFAAKDASDFAEAIQKQKGDLYRDVAIKLLANEKATKDEILDGLDWIQRETTSKDVAIVFLAGHGVNDPSGIYYFLPVNANTEKLKRTGTPFSDIKNTIASLTGKTIVFLDTCHSGNIMGKRRGALDTTGIVNELASAESGAVVFASSTGNQYSVEDPAWKNGAFTKALVEGISGKADYSGKGKITINMLDLYISERVKELTKGQQTPTTTKPQTIPDFPIAVAKK